MQNRRAQGVWPDDNACVSGPVKMYQIWPFENASKYAGVNAPAPHVLWDLRGEQTCYLSTWPFMR